MKKYFVLIFVLLVGACANSVNKKEFVNPIFNQPLRPLSSGNGYAYLTPTSIEMRTPKDRNLVDGKGECELVENTQERITLKCKYKIIPPKGFLRYLKKQLNNSNKRRQETAQAYLNRYSSIFERYYTYYIKHLLSANCLVIGEDIKNIGEDHVSAISNYCVTPPADFKSESD